MLAWPYPRHRAAWLPHSGLKSVKTGTYESMPNSEPGGGERGPVFATWSSTIGNNVGGLDGRSITDQQ